MTGVFRKPRVNPEYLARWEPHGGHWRLSVTARDWQVLDAAWTSVPVRQDHPGDDWLGKLRFAAAEGSEWEADGPAWSRPVIPVLALCGMTGGKHCLTFTN